MLERIWKFLVCFFKRWLGLRSKPQVVPQSVAPLQKFNPLTPADYESVFMQLLDGVHQGWSRGQIKGFLIGKRLIEAQFVKWLQGFGRSLLESPEPNVELARRMVQLGEVGCGEMSEVAQELGRQLLARDESQDGQPINANQSQVGQASTLLDSNSSLSTTNTTSSTTQQDLPQSVATEVGNLEAEAYFNQANQQYDEGNFLGAIKSYDQALHIKPDDHDAWHNRGMALDELGQFEEAIASYDQALQFKPDLHQAWYNRGMALYTLGQFEEAIKSYDQALHFKPDDHDAWLYRGAALYTLGQFEEAIASFDQALQFKPDFHEAWYNRGVVLENLGQLEQAIASFDQALQFKPDFHLAWFGRGNVLGKLGQFEQAIASYDQTLQFKPDFYDAWFGRGNVLGKLGQFEQAIASYDQTLQFKPDYHLAWFNRGIALGNLGQFEQAIASYDQALQFKPDDHLAWYNRGVELRELGQCEQAITSYDQALHFKPDDHKAWNNRGVAALLSVSCDRVLAFQSAIAQQHPALNQRGYEGELASYEQGLNYCPQDTHPEGWGLLHQAIGNAHYFRGRGDSRPRPYWHKALTSYAEALKTLTAATFPEAHLEVLQNLIRVYSDLGETQKVEVLLGEGTDLLGRLVQQAASDAEKIRLSRKFAAFDQLRVDAVVQSGNLCAALELAEQRKNLCLSWLHYRWSESVEDSPNYAQMQELLQPSPTNREGEKAIVYWHISPAAITTFILRYQQPPLVLGTTADLTPSSVCQLVELENWIETWNKDYQKYCQFRPQRSEDSRLKEKETETKSSVAEQECWRIQMPEQLNKLAGILNIKEILLHLKGVNQLLLIPHRDLHLLPLHTLFPDSFTITYLPSIQVGLDRKKARQNPRTRQPVASMLSVENPTENLPYVVLESALISQLYPNAQRLSQSAATCAAVKQALSQSFDIFHFAGHGKHNIDHPAHSALILANKEKLIVKELFELELSGYNLACLLACETGITSKAGLIDEFVGLASVFLAAGVTTVVGSLWKVDDLSTALLMRRLYKNIKKASNPETIDIADALKEAQNWLRNLTKEDLLEQLSLEVEISESLLLQIKEELILFRGIKKKGKPFESPYYWAAFYVTGQ